LSTRRLLLALNSCPRKRLFLALLFSRKTQLFSRKTQRSQALHVLDDSRMASRILLRLRGQLFNANNRRRVDNQREAQCQLPIIIEQWLKNAFGVRKKPKPTMNAKAISN
jgi:hypothetical protein